MFQSKVLQHKVLECKVLQCKVLECKIWQRKVLQRKVLECKIWQRKVLQRKVLQLVFTRNQAWYVCFDFWYLYFLSKLQSFLDSLTLKHYYLAQVFQ